MRLYLDSNIVFSASLTDGAIRRLLNDCIDIGHVLVMDGYVWEEARRNMIVYRSSALKYLHYLTTKVELHGTASSIGPENGRIEYDLRELPQKDKPVIAAAAALGCDMLITGDRTHFGRFFGKRLLGVEIVSPMTAAKKLL